MKCFVTGGAGFIGSNMVDALLARGDTVTVYDNLTSGRREFFEHNLTNPCFKFVKGDLLDRDALKEAMQGHDMVFHFAAHADVREGIVNTRIDLEQNVIVTHNVLEAMRESGAKKILFSSSNTVYGDADIVPTPETYGGEQTSLYGASKLYCEGLIQTYCSYYGMRSWIFRFVSFMGERYTHGVAFDFLRKLEKNPNELEILGDGTARKSFLYVKDGVHGMLTAIEKSNKPVNVFNLGSDSVITVKEIADIVCDELCLKGVKYRFTGGSAGWKGDQPRVHLSLDRIKSLGWKPTLSLHECIRKTIQYLKNNPDILYGRDAGMFVK